jgi:hypothetical protein
MNPHSSDIARYKNPTSIGGDTQNPLAIRISWTRSKRSIKSAGIMLSVNLLKNTLLALRYASTSAGYTKMKVIAPYNLG